MTYVGEDFLNTNGIDTSILNNLSEEERKLALSILSEFSSEGSSKTYEEMVYDDYAEIPVDIETFLNDDRYLGQAWKDAEGNSKVYPFWLDRLKEIFPNNFDTNYEILLETGARGIGKSEIACGICGAYLMYRVLCLKDALEYYHLKQSEKIVFAFMNIKKELAKSICISKFQKTIQLSPWFMERGRMTTLDGNPYWVPPEPVEIVIGSQSDDVIGLPVFFAFFDEISFIRNQDIDIQKKKAKNMIDTAVGGMMTRFVHAGKNPTLLVVASSKRSEQSFMEEYIKSLSSTMGNKVNVIDKPVWEVKPKGTYSDEFFYVGLGNKYLASVVINDKDENTLNTYKDKGYTIIKVPVDFKERFMQDIERNLCDFAGISSSSLSKYMAGEVVKDCINDEFKNPFPDIIEVGNAKEDLMQYKNFFNMNNVPEDMKGAPMYVHLDMSISGDMTGIAGVWITGKKPSTDESQSANDLSFRLAFSTSVKAPKGRQISFEKNRNFVRWLRECGFNLKEITSDTFQSYDLQQQLSAEGFNCSILSVDRVDKDRICKPYQYLKSAVYERRLTMYRSERLLDEFVDVERNINTGKVDHTPNGHKDVLDAVCGAIFTASKYAEEYGYKYGESLSQFVEANEGQSQSQKKQMTVDFESELLRAFSEFGNNPLRKGAKVDAEEEKRRKEYEKNRYAYEGILL